MHDEDVEVELVAPRRSRSWRPGGTCGPTRMKKSTSTDRPPGPARWRRSASGGVAARGPRRRRRRLRPCRSAALASLTYDLQEAAHVAERAHRATVAEQVAEAAGDEALPGVIARSGRHERELDGVVVEFVGHGGGAAEVGGVAVHADERDADVERGTEKVCPTPLPTFELMTRIGLPLRWPVRRACPVTWPDLLVAQRAARVVLVDRHVDPGVGGQLPERRVDPLPCWAWTR